MNIKCHLCRICLTVAFIFTFFIVFEAVGADFQKESVQENDLQYRLQNLEAVMRAIDHVALEIEAAQKVMQGAAGIGREQELRDQITDLGAKQRSLEGNFRRLAADVADTDAAKGRSERNFEWQKEILRLLSPLLQEINKITERPRQIEELRAKIESYQAELSQAEKAQKNIDRLIQESESSSLRIKLEELLRDWKGRRDEIRTRLDIAGRELDRQLSRQKTISESLRDFFRLFFKSRGRNLISSIFVFILIWCGLYFLYKPIRKYSPLHTRARSVYIRFFDLTYFIFSALLAVWGLLAVLYFFHDWVLLSIAVLFLMGMAWASKQAIPYLWLQARMILNIGPVREGEVINYHGVPYEVRSLNFYSLLENNALQGGLIRLPIKDLIEFRSRPKTADEPWFPNRVGEWVKLKDGTHGRIITQTPETVMVKKNGGAVVFYKTSDYLSFCPTNLSHGFRLFINLPLGHENFAAISGDILRIFETEMTPMLIQSGYGDAMLGIRVLFKSARRSSLELEILADFGGSAASDYDTLPGTMARICMDICKRHNWRPPLHQIRVHLDGPQY